MGSDLLKGCSRGQLSILHLSPGLLEGVCCSVPVQVVLAIVPCTRKGFLCVGVAARVATLLKVQHCSIRPTFAKIAFLTMPSRMSSSIIALKHWMTPDSFLRRDLCVCVYTVVTSK